MCIPNHNPKWCISDTHLTISLLQVRIKPLVSITTSHSKQASTNTDLAQKNVCCILKNNEDWESFGEAICMGLSILLSKGLGAVPGKLAVGFVGALLDELLCLHSQALDQTVNLPFFVPVPSIDWNGFLSTSLPTESPVLVQ